MNPLPSTNLIKPLLAFAFAGLALHGPALHAQAQSLLSSNQVVISRVENINPTTILISGVNFEKFKGAPVVSVSGAGASVAVLPSTFNAAAKDITAILPASVATIPGSYRLMVSFGSGTAGTDVFEFTVGAIGPVGPKGDKGEKGDTGARGAQGETGLQGPKGNQGDTGAQGIQGVKGDTGAQGPKGDKGDKGDQGIQGVKGDTGAEGPQGARGETGAQGLVGPAGPAGASGHFPTFQNVVEARASGIKPGQVWVQESSGQVFQMVN